MRKNLLLFFMFLGCGFAQTQERIPTCRLGTDWAVDTRRGLAPGGGITTRTGGIVVLAQRETPGSTHIVFRRCILPVGTEVVIGGTEPWVKECGNALIQTEGWSLPLAASQKILGPQGPKGEKGDPGIQGPVGSQGPKGDPGEKRDSVKGDREDPEITVVVTPPSQRWWRKRWFKVVAFIGGGLAGYSVSRAIVSRVHKNPVIIIRTGP